MNIQHHSLFIITAVVFMPQTSLLAVSLFVWLIWTSQLTSMRLWCRSLSSSVHHFPVFDKYAVVPDIIAPRSTWRGVRICVSSLVLAVLVFNNSIVGVFGMKEWRLIQFKGSKLSGFPRRQLGVTADDRMGITSSVLDKKAGCSIAVCSFGYMQTCRILICWRSQLSQSFRSELAQTVDPWVTPVVSDSESSPLKEWEEIKPC